MDGTFEMALTPLQKETLANELIDVMERFQSHVETHSESYEAFIMQPSPDHIVIKIQPSKDTG
ncbi:hypothetical protein K1Y77_04290 [Halomonas qaidamensis]|uniref:Uncharacterized protein n=1 Tax=Halomonas qaidamensis TaxID=2866211 RepID=A0ABY6JRM5_9GAMM|nr:hypothetical protein [Halomonas qaidamensis]UYV19903.1 hypothetical protein K1Y77_04290 [Halomonas qaidamensis]